MNAQHFEVFTAIGTSDAARIANPAVYIRLQRNPVPNGKPGSASGFTDLAGQFMPDYPWIGHQRVCTPVSTDVGTADAGRVNGDHHFIIPDGSRGRNILDANLERGCEVY
jgi:hypothetical protein